jgi:hypothetical protein
MNTRTFEELFSGLDGAAEAKLSGALAPVRFRRSRQGHYRCQLSGVQANQLVLEDAGSGWIEHDHLCGCRLEVVAQERLGR